MLRIVAALIAAVIFVGCASDGPDGDGEVQSSGISTAVSTSTDPANGTPELANPSDSAAGTATVDRAPLEPLALGESRALDRGVSTVRWQPYEAGAVADADAGSWEKLYEVERDELWTAVGADGTPYWLSLSPNRDVGIGTAWNAEQSEAAEETVYVDLESGRVEQLFAFAVQVMPWLGPDRGLVRIGAGRATDGWSAGWYELDFATERVTLISTAERFVETVATPSDSVLGVGVVEWRVSSDSGDSSLIFRDAEGDAERVIVDRVANVRWSPNRRYAAVVRADRTISLLDLRGNELLELDELSVPLSAVRWSPDGRYLVSFQTTPVAILDLSELDANFDVEAVRVIGPFEQAIFADWGPGAKTSEALLLGSYCAPDGFRLDRLDLESSELERIPTTVGGFWVYDWSPRGDLIAVSTRDLQSGFVLIDASSGERQVRPGLDGAVRTMQDAGWSASGRWIKLHEIGGRDRCFN